MTKQLISGDITPGEMNIILDDLTVNLTNTNSTTAGTMSIQCCKDILKSNRIKLH